MEYTDNISYLLNKAARLSKLKVNQKLSEFGLTFPQLLIIKHLVDSGPEDHEIIKHTPAAIAEYLGYDRPTITGILDRMEKQGFVSREANPTDRRSQTIILTPKSKALLQKMDRVFEEVTQKTLTGFQTTEIGEIKTYLLRIIGNLADGLTMEGPDSCEICK